ncbi:MAG: tetratricopeptide repeat protein [Deltaproteobacteria bacterium]|jgi:tetratricopeptide (TPR) repeat protein|nr:tetratricopeptide repeat protein [Deltaproteobacteria bacterium]
MSKTLFDARKKLSSVGAMLRQDKVANAVQVLYNGLQEMMREQLLRSEREEFTNIIDTAVKDLNANKKIQKQFNITITYTPGEEGELLETIRLLMETLDSLALEEADQAYRDREARKKANLEKAISEIEAGNLSAARVLCASIAAENSDDVVALVDIAEAFERAGQLQDAIEYMEKARRLDGQASYILNRLGILHRKARNFNESEKMFSEAEIHTPDDPYLLFNKGRLYIDWQKWQQALEAANASLNLQPDFSEARKMAEYAAKRI